MYVFKWCNIVCPLDSDLKFSGKIKGGSLFLGHPVCQWTFVGKTPQSSFWMYCMNHVLGMFHSTLPDPPVYATDLIWKCSICVRAAPKFISGPRRGLACGPPLPVQAAQKRIWSVRARRCSRAAPGLVSGPRYDSFLPVQAAQKRIWSVRARSSPML